MRAFHALAGILTGTIAAGLMTTSVAAQTPMTAEQFAAALGGKPAQVAAEPAATEDDDGYFAAGDTSRAFSLARPASAGTTGGAKAAGMAPRHVARLAGSGNRATYRPGAARPAAGRALVAPMRATPAAVELQLSFANGSAELDDRARAMIAPLAEALTNPQLLSTGTFRIAGHTNSIGSRESNIDLSRRRAQAVVDYLVSKGVAAGRMASTGLGPDVPLPGRTPADPANRRVEIARN